MVLQITVEYLAHTNALALDKRNCNLLTKVVPRPNLQYSRLRKVDRIACGIRIRSKEIALYV